MSAIPVIETDRLRLRAPSEADFAQMQEYLGQERMVFIGGPFDAVGIWRTLLGMLGHWSLRGFGFWNIEHKETGQLAGAVGFLHHFDWPEPELGWNVHHDFEGQGIAFEAASAAQAYGEECLNLSQVISFIDPQNTRSAELAKRLGATFERKHSLRGKACHIYRHPKHTPHQQKAFS